MSTIRVLWPELNQRQRAIRIKATYPHYIYRCYDAAGLLLYIGCTDDPKRREAEHRAGKTSGASKFLSQHMAILEADATAYPNREAGQQAEAECIFVEQPLINIHHRCIPARFIKKQIEDYEAGRPVRKWAHKIWPRNERLAGPEPTESDLRDAALKIDQLWSGRGWSA